MNRLLFQNETYTVIGLCMEVHRILGYGFSEIVYKDALSFEAKQKGIHVEREKEYKLSINKPYCPIPFFADFIFYNKIIVEVKAQEGSINNACISQTLNYLKASDCRIGLIINFGRRSLEHQRVIF